jgi:hypothetical protein
MAATAFSENRGLQPTLAYVEAPDDQRQETRRPDLLTAAYRNTFGKGAVRNYFQRVQATLHVAAPSKSYQEPRPPVVLPANPPLLETKPTAALAPALPAQDVLQLPTVTRLKSIEWQRRQQLMVSIANRGLPAGCQVMVWSIVPVELFQGELGRFLMIACDFHACGPENTMLLPSMPSGAQHSKLLRHPLIVSEAHLHMAQSRVTLLRDRVASEHRHAELAMNNGDLSQLFGRSISKAKYCDELRQIVQGIAKSQLPADTVENHRAQFGNVIAAM